MLFCFSSIPRTSPAIWIPSSVFSLLLNLEMTSLLLLRLSFLLNITNLMFSGAPFHLLFLPSPYCDSQRFSLPHSDSSDNDFEAILDDIDKELDLGDLMGELGCGLTADAQQCKEILSTFAPLGEAAIARILGNVARSCPDREDNHTTFPTFALALGCCIPTELPTPRSWNADILIETIIQLVSHLNQHH